MVQITHKIVTFPLFLHIYRHPSTIKRPSFSSIMDYLSEESDLMLTWQKYWNLSPSYQDRTEAEKKERDSVSVSSDRTQYTTLQNDLVLAIS